MGFSQIPLALTLILLWAKFRARVDPERNGPVGETGQIHRSSCVSLLGKLQIKFETSADSMAQYITDSSLFECPGWSGSS